VAATGRAKGLYGLCAEAPVVEYYCPLCLDTKSLSGFVWQIAGMEIANVVWLHHEGREGHLLGSRLDRPVIDHVSDPVDGGNASERVLVVPSG
jgi:hypothetical protein